MSKRFRIAAMLAALAGACAAIAAEPARPPVGVAFAAYDDAARRNWADTGPRPLGTVVWYPAAAGSREAPWTVEIFDAGRVAKDATMAPRPAKLPLVLLSHGTGGAGPTLAWLAETLAARGYVVAAVNHHGNTGAEPAYRLEGFMVWWDRPRDLSLLIDKLLADPRFGPRIDASRIGVAGFSLGGYTTLAMVGARLDYAKWRAHCDAAPADVHCKLPPEIASKFAQGDAERLLRDDPRMKQAYEHMGDSYRDARIRSAYAIAPVMGPVFVPQSLAQIDVPVRIVVGTRDDQAVPELTARPVAAAIPHATLELVPGATHYVWLATCNTLGRTVARQVCVDPEGLDRDALHQRTADDAAAFFDRTLAAAAHP